MIVVQGVLRLHLDDLKKAREIAAPFVRQTQGENGCLSYALAEDLMAPGLIHIIERWRDAAALAAHRAAPHTAAFTAELPRLRILDLKIVDYRADDGQVAMGG